MCGIAGILDEHASGPPQAGELRTMIETLHHRGPDGYGFFTDAACGLAHARLSIIDLSTGEQPIHNEDRTVWVVLNGEIFNYIELRAQLQAAGHAFYTQSDTEVIVHLYEQHGDDFVHHLNGQFAIALWDQKRSRLVLARDRTGIRPLFHTRHDGACCSPRDQGAVRAGWRATTPDPVALGDTMTYWSTLEPDTVFQGVRCLPAGCLLAIEAGGSISRTLGLVLRARLQRQHPLDRGLGERAASAAHRLRAAAAAGRRRWVRT
jgi:asparagine synthase (glutamine-hydrolysing)